MGMIDEQYKDQILRDTLKENKELKQEVQMLEKLIELNLKDLWDMVDQRDWYYSEYQRSKSQNQSKNTKK